jgi:hypothetical protein
MNIFERKVYRRIFAPVGDSGGGGDRRILTNKETYAVVKKTHYNRDIKFK